MLTSFNQILDRAQKSGPLRYVVAGSVSEAVISAVVAAHEKELMSPILVGDKRKTQKLADSLGLDISGMDIVPADSDQLVAEKSATLLSEGEADVLMKGMISTPVLLKAVLQESKGLRKGKLLSHIAILELPTYHKLIMMTDSGMIPRPDLTQKTGILHNAIGVQRKLGVEHPKIAVLAANEKVSAKLPETADAAELVKLAKSNEFGEVYLEGPMALDMAFDPEAAKIKGVDSVVSGDPDMLLMPDVSGGNIFAKGLVYLANAKLAGIIVGAKMPIVLISRAESSETMLRSIALANLTVDK